MLTQFSCLVMRIRGEVGRSFAIAIYCTPSACRLSLLKSAFLWSALSDLWSSFGFNLCPPPVFDPFVGFFCLHSHIFDWKWKLYGLFLLVICFQMFVPFFVSLSPFEEIKNLISNGGRLGKCVKNLKSHKKGKPILTTTTTITHVRIETFPHSISITIRLHAQHKHINI